MIRVIGMGPGHKNYILPEAIQHIKKAQMVIGSKRHLNAIQPDLDCQGTMDYVEGFDRIRQYLETHYEDEIAVIVSGDASFYSMLGFVQRTVEEDYIDVIPGISSLQYMYAKIKRGYEDARWISYHGREVDVIETLAHYSSVGILTDSSHSPAYIARQLYDHDIKDCAFYIGEELSYNQERIQKMTIEEAMHYEAKSLSVVVIEYDR